MNSDLPLNPSEIEARASLAEIDRVVERTRKAISYGIAAPLLILWGTIWLIGFSSSQFNFGSFHFSGIVWAVLDAAGFAVSVAFSSWYRKTRVKNPVGRQIGLSFLALMLFAVVWAYLLIGARHGAGSAGDSDRFFQRLSAFICTVAMFGYVIMGLWLGRFYLWLGLAVTLVTLAGYTYLPGYFYLWMAVFGGGSLIAAGVYALKFWR